MDHNDNNDPFVITYSKTPFHFLSIPTCFNPPCFAQLKQLYVIFSGSFSKYASSKI